MLLSLPTLPTVAFQCGGAGVCEELSTAFGDLVNSRLSVRKKKHGESFSRLTRGFSIRRVWKVHVGLVTFHDLPLLRSEDVDGDFSRTPFEDVDGDFDL